MFWLKGGHNWEKLLGGVSYPWSLKASSQGRVLPWLMGVGYPQVPVEVGETFGTESGCSLLTGAGTSLPSGTEAIC